MIRQTFSTLAVLLFVLPGSAYSSQLNSENSQKLDKSQIVQMISFKGTGRQGDVIKQFLEKSNLTEEQSRQVKAISERHYAANKPNYQELQQAKKDMRSLLANNANPHQLRKKHLVIQSLSQKVVNNRFEAMLEIKDILTTEQLKKLADIFASYQD